MKSTSRRRRISKTGSKVSGSSKKASHRRPHKPFDPAPPIPPYILRAKDDDPDKYNTHNPFDHDIPLHDETGQPQSLPRGTIACPTGVVCARVLYPTSSEFSRMHAVKPANRFGPTGARGAVASLVEQLKAGGLDPDDEIMLAYLKQIDMDGQFREHYHNAAEACERAEVLHPIHRKMVRYRRARRDGALSRGDYADLKDEDRQRRRAEARLREEEEARQRASEEAKRREEERVRAEEEARREAQRRGEEERRRQRELEQQRLDEQRERARQEEIREVERVQELRRQWEVQQEQLRHEEEERRRVARLERERRDRSMIRRWTAEREQEEWQARFERDVREYNESIRRVREFEENQRAAKVLEDIARYRSEAVASYEALWKKLRARECPPQCFSFDNFPLPIFVHSGKPDLEKITPEAIAEFVLSPLRSDAHVKSLKSHVKEEMLSWHSDKFSSVILPTVREFDQEQMVLAADNIMKILTELNEKLR
ncbi:hypothetical protein GSI_03327 [Ganoderma sinense ZZ0214-1]|uniref:Uncharacterized protein n=1 Tax=Ganoderma sinense ZZ0214-1 TaxID=1077348 RepID=A0A2G8SLC1_9APHY|nr:hypothetical protein GSI_03327 [Ganoderma sinense ZZ0214-1]